MDKREYWSTKSPRPTYEAVTFAHPSFAATIRLVANVYADVTLAGNLHTAAPMSIRPPDQKNVANPKLTIAFPRQVVGRQFKQQLAVLALAGSRAPIVVTFSKFLGDVSVPQVSWVLYAADQGGVNFSADQVQVSATMDNPLRRAVAPVYLPETFTGLEGV